MMQISQKKNNLSEQFNTYQITDRITKGLFFNLKKEVKKNG